MRRGIALPRVSFPRELDPGRSSERERAFPEGSWTIPDKDWHDSLALNLFAPTRLRPGSSRVTRYLPSSVLCLDKLSHRLHTEWYVAAHYRSDSG